MHCKEGEEEEEEEEAVSLGIEYVTLIFLRGVYVWVNGLTYSLYYSHGEGGGAGGGGRLH